MKWNHRLVLPAIAFAAVICSPAASLAQGGRGNSTGTPGIGAPAINLFNPVIRPGQLDDLDQTAITRMNEGITKQIAANTAAHAALAVAIFAQPSNAADIKAKVQTVADTDLALALARAEAFSKLKSEIKDPTPERLNAFRMAASGMGGGRGGGAGGGRAAPGAAPAGPGAAPQPGQAPAGAN